MTVRRRVRIGATAGLTAVLAATTACTGSSSPPAHHPAATPVSGGTATGGLTPAAAALDAAMTAAAGSFRGGAFTAAVVTDTGTWSAAVGADGTGTRLVPQAESAVGSISKTFTTAEILHLADTGALALDDPTSRYVTSPLTRNGATIRQTLSMTSGIRDGAMIGQFAASVSSTPDRHMTPAQMLLGASPDLAPIGAPGSYSNAGFLLLGQIVERVTGLTYAAAVRRDLLGPTGLRRVAVQTDEKPVAPVAYPIDSGEKPVTDGWVPDRANASAAGGAGSIAADAPDVARWGHDLYAAHTVVPAADVAAMTRPVSLRGQYGLGTLITSAHDSGLAETTVGHDGGISRVTAGGIQATSVSLLVVVPAQGISVAVLVPSNADLTATTRVATALVRAAGGH